MCEPNEIEAHETVLKMKDSLFALSADILTAYDIATFRRKLMAGLKQLLPINGLMILREELDNGIDNPFFLDFNQNNHTESVEQQHVDQVVHAQAGDFIKQIWVSTVPLMWQMSDLMKLKQRPSWLTRFRVNNVKQIVATRFTDKEGKKGTIFFFSDDVNGLGAKDFGLIADITSFLSHAVLMIQHLEKQTVMDRDSALVIPFLKNLANVHNRKEFENFLIKEFQRMAFVSEACIFLPKNGEDVWVPTITKQARESVFGKEWLQPDRLEIENAPTIFSVFKDLKSINTVHFNELLQCENLPLAMQTWFKTASKKWRIVLFSNGLSIVGAMLLFFETKTDWEFYRSFWEQIKFPLNTVISNVLLNENRKQLLNEIDIFKRQLGIESQKVKNQNQDFHNYIIGDSPKMKEVFQLITKVAGTESSVLILGETGTGKELLARAIHNSSLRKDQPFIKVNCATIPANLMETELFGHERGSFTGAFERKIGKFEMANNGTIFLDEIGELPLTLQTKLLRALQEKEIERIGGKATIKTDIRIIAATNRDLLKASQNGSFRSDLYFRLNVFPVKLPALRERKEDIPLLVNHFASKYGERHKTAKYFSSKALKQLTAYNWPGNIRELEHLVQRSVILCKGKVIPQVYLPSPDGGDRDVPLSNRDIKTIDEVQRDHILAVLKMVNGKVSGVGGAAEMLKVPATTLSSKIIKLKIKKGFTDQQDKS